MMGRLSVALTSLLTFLCLCVVPAKPAPGPFELIVGLPLRNLDQLEALFWDVATPGSREYLRHRSLDELADLVGAPSRDTEAIQQWLKALGASATHVSALRDTVVATFVGAPKGSISSSHGWSPNGLPNKSLHPMDFDFVLRTQGSTRWAVQSNNATFKGWITDKTFTVDHIKERLGMPKHLKATNSSTSQMVWGPGTFGVSRELLEEFKHKRVPLLDMDKVRFDTSIHGVDGGDNFVEGNLDTAMISAFGLGVETVVSNTNASVATEGGEAFGAAMLKFVTDLAQRSVVPHVLSLSLGSLSPASCDLLCKKAIEKGHTNEECRSFLQEQRQICMFDSQRQAARINAAFMVLGLRGVSIFVSSGDGGSHFAFAPVDEGVQPIARTINEVSCGLQLPIFPSESPYVVSVGGTFWEGNKTIAWANREGLSCPPTGPGPDGCAGGCSGSGFSWQFARPVHQSQSVNRYLSRSQSLPQAASFNVAGRAYPDVAAVAKFGTSQSAPIVAGIFSMVNDHRFKSGLSPLGFLAPRIWRTAEEHPGSVFMDVNSGRNTSTSCNNGFHELSGWDPVTGWGSPIWDGLLEHFGSEEGVVPNTEIWL